MNFSCVSCCEPILGIRVFAHFVFTFLDKVSFNLSSSGEQRGQISRVPKCPKHFLQ